VTSNPVAQRLVALLGHLGISQAHYAGRVAGDYAGLITDYPERVVSLALICPTGFDPAVVRPLADRLLLIHGDCGPNAPRASESSSPVPGSFDLPLRDYFEADWSDVLAERTDEVGTVLLGFLARHSEQQHIASVALSAGDGEIAGISYHVQGQGPPVVLLPLALAPSQWEPLVSRLSLQYCTIRLGGAWLGYAAVLEDRAGSPGYRAMSQRVMDEVALRPGETVLDVGCGTGSLDRWLARRTAGANPIVATDVNRYLLDEATLLACREGVDHFITFREGNAEALPFPDESFDVTASITVMEEVDAGRMLLELLRVTRPGGRVAVVVRAEDRSWLINLPLQQELKARVERTSSGGAALLGCADASLYQRFFAVGLIEVKMRPQLVAFDTAGPYTETLESQILATLVPQEAEAWKTARGQAEAAGTFLIARQYHAAVGTKPSAN
jgi:SAM-dependent methyltransferase